MCEGHESHFPVSACWIHDGHRTTSIVSPTGMLTWFLKVSFHEQAQIAMLRGYTRMLGMAFWQQRWWRPLVHWSFAGRGQWAVHGSAREGKKCAHDRACSTRQRARPQSPPPRRAPGPRSPRRPGGVAVPSWVCFGMNRV